MRDGAFTGEVAIEVARPLHTAWIGGVALSLLVIGWLFVHAVPAALFACALLGGSVGQLAREVRLRWIRLDSQGRWSGACGATVMDCLTPTRQVVSGDLIVLGFRAVDGVRPGGVALTPGSVGAAAFRRVAARLRLGAPGTADGATR